MNTISAYQKSWEQCFKYLLSVIQEKGYVKKQVFNNETSYFMSMLANEPMLANRCGSQEPNPIFLLGTSVQYSPIKCSQKPTS